MSEIQLTPPLPPSSMALAQIATAFSFAWAPARTALEKGIADRRAKARRIVPLEPTLAAAYAGRYQFPDRIATITREGSCLFIDFPRGARAELFAESPTQLFLKIRPWTMIFVREGERVVRIDILDTGEIVPAPRVE